MMMGWLDRIFGFHPSAPTLPEPTPGRWLGDYMADWEAAHPGQWLRGEAQSGGWYLGHDGADVWCGSTLEWDAQWFAAHGMSLPKRHSYRLDELKPNSFRIGTLGPGESVEIPIWIVAPEHDGGV